MASSPIDFVTLGMFIIDDIYPPPAAASQTPQLNIIGGAGTYSAIGARLFSPAPSTSKSIGWIVDAGTDFPSSLRETINAWNTGVLLRDRTGLTTRGWNGYGENDHRSFKYLTEKIRLTASDLTPEFLASKSFHLICSPLRCIDQVTGILMTRDSRIRKPIVIWEPVPDLCTPAELQNALIALKYVDVVSPNHEELASLFGFEHGLKVSTADIEAQAQKLLESGVGSDGQGAIVVRAGALGCFLLSRNTRRWLPAYHTDASRVVDPTGGGNGFLGGLSVGLVRRGFDVVEAARWGSVAASLCIEQVGMPQLQSGDGGSERWNGVSVTERLSEFQQRTV